MIIVFAGSENHFRRGLGVLVVEGLTAGYGGRWVLQEVSFTVAPREMVGLVGPNGAGKSTLLKALLGLIPQWRGQVWLDGQPLWRQRRRVAYVPQRSQIDWDYPITVEQVVGLGCWRPIQGAVEQALQQLGLEPLRRRRIGDLSGGQQQRVFLARALAQSADVFLLDEPMTGIDAHAEQVMTNVLQQLRQRGAMIVMSTHHWGPWLQQMNRVLLLNGRLIALGPPHEVMTPDYLKVAYALSQESHFPHRSSLFC